LALLLPSRKTLAWDTVMNPEKSVQKPETTLNVSVPIEQASSVDLADRERPSHTEDQATALVTG